ncbi:hypothetical protein NRB20_70490 [Nocardia sp. RB20]|uniref:Uncharacterized protein n=1 Tax=Nocardia macrotermitis TaxID=2585198 RepID=A0A7K0DDN5_9NOCA|nr:hypothetical protein [Nocardia macrotermitis]
MSGQRDSVAELLDECLNSCIMQMSPWHAGRDAGFARSARAMDPRSEFVPIVASSRASIPIVKAV